jgi:hypothetical protein
MQNSMLADTRVLFFSCTSFSRGAGIAECDACVAQQIPLFTISRSPDCNVAVCHAARCQVVSVYVSAERLACSIAAVGVQDLVKACGKHCPEAVLNIISNPINSTVPIAVETLKAMGTYDKRKVMGVTTLDVVRAKTFYAEKARLDVKVCICSCSVGFGEADWHSRFCGPATSCSCICSEMLLPSSMRQPRRPVPGPEL